MRGRRVLVFTVREDIVAFDVALGVAVFTRFGGAEGAHFARVGFHEGVVVFAERGHLEGGDEGGVGGGGGPGDEGDVFGVGGGWHGGDENP